VERKESIEPPSRTVGTDVCSDIEKLLKHKKLRIYNPEIFFPFRLLSKWSHYQLTRDSAEPLL
jgi:hypothetical protein